MRKPIKLNETITQNDVDFALKNLGAVIDAMKIEDKTQIELTAICKCIGEMIYFFIKMKDGTFRAAGICFNPPDEYIYSIWGHEPDYVWQQKEIASIIKR